AEGGDDGDASDRPGYPAVEAEPDQVPDGDHQEDDEDVADQVRHVAPVQHGGAGNRHGPEAVNDPAGQVFLQADRRLRGAEGDRLDEDPGQQEVDVGDPVRQRAADRAAEHVDEQQHKQDRLDGGEDQQVRLADEVTQVAARDHGGVGDGRPHGLRRRAPQPQ